MSVESLRTSLRRLWVSVRETRSDGVFEVADINNILLALSQEDVGICAEVVSYYSRRLSTC